jgi:hypothetical protein
MTMYKSPVPYLQASSMKAGPSALASIALGSYVAKTYTVASLANLLKYTKERDRSLRQRRSGLLVMP